MINNNKNNIFDSYETWKIVKMIVSLTFIILYLFIICRHCTLAMFLIYSAITVIFFFLYRFCEGRFFPQWRELNWNNKIKFLIWIILMISLFFFMRPGTFKPIYIIISGTFLFPTFIKAFIDTYYTKKFHLDNNPFKTYIDYYTYCNEIKKDDYFFKKYGIKDSEINYENIEFEKKCVAIENLIETSPEAFKKLHIHTRTLLKDKTNHFTAKQEK